MENKNQNQQNQNQQDQKPQQVRGADLRDKIIQSQVEGEEYRASHQGADVLEERYNEAHKPLEEHSKKDVTYSAEDAGENFTPRN